jgi:hypothetical protein
MAYPGFFSKGVRCLLSPLTGRWSPPIRSSSNIRQDSSSRTASTAAVHRATSPNTLTPSPSQSGYKSPSSPSPPLSLFLNRDVARPPRSLAGAHRYRHHPCSIPTPLQNKHANITRSTPVPHLLQPRPPIARGRIRHCGSRTRARRGFLHTVQHFISSRKSQKCRRHRPLAAPRQKMSLEP